MASAEQIHAMVESYLNGFLSLDSFEEWFLSHTWNAHLDAEARVDLIHHIEGALLDFSAQALNIDALNRELANAVLPFAESRLAWEKYPLGVFVQKGIAPRLSALGRFDIGGAKTEVIREPMTSATSASPWYREQVARPV